MASFTVNAAGHIWWLTLGHDRCTTQPDDDETQGAALERAAAALRPFTQNEDPGVAALAQEACRALTALAAGVDAANDERADDA